MRALLFDFDGVIADSETLHFQVFREVLREEGIPLTRQEYEAVYVGIDDAGCFRRALQRHGRLPDAAQVEELVAR
ncbi:MAG: HAD hydrolase-like protein, partial [Armatimonadota bacterium]|nr:HAD hydrolase-like protein [Armatimonadota bacterium]